MKAECDVVFATWNQLDLVKRCVDSFLSNTYVPSRLIIIDNGSTDGTVEYLSSLRGSPICEIKVIFNSTNQGAVKGRNQGIKLSNAPYVCISDNDLLFTKGWLREIISVFEKNKKIGLLNPGSNSLGLRPGKSVSLEDFAKDLRRKCKSQFIQMPFCISFCMVTKKSVIDKVGAFSEEYSPMFFEDTDYSMKVQKAGYLVGVTENSYVWHVEHGSIKNMGNEKSEYYFNRSKKLFFKKWGKILRIAWIVDNYKELVDNLEEGINLSRQGNYVWFFVKDLDKTKAKIFKENNLIEHSGVNFIKYNNLFDIAFKILKKKKKYNPLISDNRMIKYLFPKLGYNVLNELTKGKIEKIKRL